MPAWMVSHRRGRGVVARELAAFVWLSITREMMRLRFAVKSRSASVRLPGHDSYSPANRFMYEVESVTLQYDEPLTFTCEPSSRSMLRALASSTAYADELV